MDRDRKLWDEVAMPIYRKMYKEATPSRDFDEMINSGEVAVQDFFRQYYLDICRQNEIIDECVGEVKKRLRLRKREIQKIRTTVMLGCSPTTRRNDE